MGILSGKTIFATGVRAETSIAHRVVYEGQKAGGKFILGVAPREVQRVMSILHTFVEPPRVVCLDVTDPAQIGALADAIDEPLNGALHSIAFIPRDGMGNFLATSSKSFSVGAVTSAFSFKELARGVLPLFQPASSYVGVTFDGSKAWPAYDWMGVNKSALETVNRYLARELGKLGHRSNLVSPGPIDTPAARGIPGIGDMIRHFEKLSPLPWDLRDAARTAVMMLSDWFAGVSGEIVHVDGGAHSQGAAA